jgi:hypothetical protein
VGLAALFGLPFGAAGALLHGRTGVASPKLAGDAIGGDLEAAAKLAEAIPKEVAPELHAAVESEVLDRLAVADRPADVPPEAGAQAARESIRFGEDPDSAPLPSFEPMANSDFRAAIDQRARALDPETFGEVDRLDEAISRARARINGLMDQGEAPASEFFRHRVADLQSQVKQAERDRIAIINVRVADLQAQVAEITGKRRSSPRAKTLAAKLDAALAEQAVGAPGADERGLSAEIERLSNAGQSLVADSAQRRALEEQTSRLHLNDLQQQRGKLGPAVFAARNQAEEEARAIGIEHSPLDGLSPEAADQVERGAVDPAYAQHVARMVADPEEHASYVSMLAEARPRGEDEARMAISDEMRGRSFPEATQALLGEAPGAEAPRELPEPAFPRETPADAGKQVEDLKAGLDRERLVIFGQRIEATPETWLEAVERARSLGDGEIVGALERPELGPISAPWRVPGDETHGLSGLMRRGRTDLVERLPAIIRDGELRMGASRAFIETPGERAVVRLDWRPDAASPTQDKKWVLTVYDRDRPRGEATPRDELPERAASPSPPATEKIGVAGDESKGEPDLLDMVPLAEREDGADMRPARTEDILREPARETLLSHLVKDCQI